MNILFVCTGNTCRSCMAEAIFNYLNDSKEFKAKSAGLAAVPGSVTSCNTAKIVDEKINVDLSKRNSVQVTEDLVQEADLILTMTHSMKELLSNILPMDSNRIFCIDEYVGKDSEIVDPYGGDIKIYNETYEQLKTNIILLLSKLKGDRLS